MSKTKIPEDYAIIGPSPREQRAIERVMAQFPPGSLVTIQWMSRGMGYDEEEQGIEFDSPEPALLLRHFPEHAFKSNPGRDVRSNPKGWVVPFECVHKGVVRMSTTYAAEVIGRMPKPGERK